MDLDGKHDGGPGAVAQVHSYTKLGTSSTAALRKFPHSLRHDQKTQSRLKRFSAPVAWPGSHVAARSPLHQSSPDLGVVGSRSHSERLVDRFSRNVPLKGSDSLPQLNHRLRLLHSLLPRITRTISESRDPSRRKSSGGWRRCESHATLDGVLQRLANQAASEAVEDDERTSLIGSPCGDKMPSIKSCMSRRPEWQESLTSLSGVGTLGEAEKPVVTLTAATSASHLALHVEPIKATNRLRVPGEGGGVSRMCSRCSSLLSMASSSRYSINTTGSFAPCSPAPEPLMLCKLCLMEVPLNQSLEIRECDCVFCRDCMRLYVEYEIQEGAYDISCPDAQCRLQGTVTVAEVETLVTRQMMDRYLRFRLNHEVDMDRTRTWCPRAGCETVCSVCPREKCAPTSVHCPTCSSDFCSNCKNGWHQGSTCEENSKRLLKEGRGDLIEPGLSFNSELIKCCPMCSVPIEKDEGCAQMMCKRCKHVFCWYCLASLDDDFLLRHYDKGPCKNKLGHSRARVIWHRTQVIGIFAGFGILLLVASPLLLLAAPCIVCCKCRVCSGGSKLDTDDDLPDESAI